MQQVHKSNAGKVLIGLVSVVMLMIGLSFSSPATVNAQAGQSFDTDRYLNPGSTCPAGMSYLGDIVNDAFWQDHTVCRLNGLNPISTPSTCNAGIAALGLGAWIQGTGQSACLAGSYVMLPGDVCGSPLILVNTSSGQNVCGYALVSTGGSGHAAHTPVCIESDFVQNDPATVNLRVSSSYMASGGETYLIISGAPTCEFNCHRGFDANCDDKLGDYCPVELDITTVKGVAACLKALNPDAPAN